MLFVVQEIVFNFLLVGCFCALCKKICFLMKLKSISILTLVLFMIVKAFIFQIFRKIFNNQYECIINQSAFGIHV